MEFKQFSRTVCKGVRGTVSLAKRCATAKDEYSPSKFGAVIRDLALVFASYMHRWFCHTKGKHAS